MQKTFPWVLNSYPNLTAYAIYNKTSHYTSADVKQIIEYAKVSWSSYCTRDLSLWDCFVV